MAFLSVDSPEAADLLETLTDEERKANWHLVQRNGDDLVMGEAAIAVLELLAPTRWLGVACRRLRLGWLLGWIDWVFKKARGRLGRFVPDRPGPERFP